MAFAGFDSHVAKGMKKEKNTREKMIKIVLKVMDEGKP